MKFIKDLDIGEGWANYTKSYVISSMGEVCKNEFTAWNSAYMQRESSATDADPDEQMLEPRSVSDYWAGIPKHYM